MMPSKKSKTRPKPNIFTFEAIGTQWIIELQGRQFPASLQKRILERIDEFDVTYSRFRPDSLVTRISQVAGMYSLPSDAKPMLDLYNSLYNLTEGKMTPLIGQTLADAGYDADYSLQPKQLTQSPAWESTIHYTATTLTVVRPALLDFGAAGKGYLVDIIAKLLHGQGISSFVINAGGDMRVENIENPLRIGLEHPLDARQAIGVAEISRGSLCGSAGNRRRWADFTHIMHPKTLRSPDHILAVWVYATSTLLADGLTTALYFTSAENLQKAYTFEYAIMLADHSLQTSDNFPATFFTSEE